MNRRAVWIVGVCLTLVLGVPLLYPGDDAPAVHADLQLVVISPHNEQIRYEFARAFAVWHEAQFGEAAQIAWSVPGGTSEIRRMLQSQYAYALEQGKSLGGAADLVFGGGSYEHSVLKQGVTAIVDGEQLHASISMSGGLQAGELDAIYGRSMIADTPLYDAQGYWYGTALSGFGIVWNNEVLADLGIGTPGGWEALADPRLRGRVALVNPAQSGSITTAFEAMLENLGWERGWQVLRRAAGNARYFSASSLKPPADVSQGDAAMGVCIDFYGRYQAQALRAGGGGDRVGYLDPPGATMIDPDPISMLRGAPSPELARRFIRFCLSDEGQALWQFAIDDEHEDGLGPRKFELRRLPVRASMYARHLDRMIDRVNPFDTARVPPFADAAMRSYIAPLFSAMAMDHHEELVRAWEAILTHPAYPDTDAIVTAADVEDGDLSAMLAAFDAMPMISEPGGSLRGLATREDRAIIKRGWLREGWEDQGLWPREDRGGPSLRRDSAAFFRGQYANVVGDRR